MTNMVLLQTQGTPGGGSMWIWMIVILVVMWILMLRPQRKKEKEEQKFRSGLKKGDRVKVEVSNGTVLTVEKSMIQPAPEAKAEEKK